MKKILKIVVASILLLAVLRGPVFRFFITYRNIGSRPTIVLTNQDLIQKIEATVVYRNLDINEVLEIADGLTTDHLSFTTGKVSSDPNVLAFSQKANCVGYAAMYSSIANYLIAEHGLQDELVVQHKIGKLNFLGTDLHQFSDSPFFKDHDFNVVTNKNTGEATAVDASVSDYLWVGKVSHNL